MKNSVFFILVFFVLSCQDKNSVPFCSIISPETDTIVKKGEPIVLKIEASDKDGVVTEVGILFEKTLIHTLYESPFEYELSTAELEPGQYEIAVYAVNDAGYNSSDFIHVAIEIFLAEIQLDTISEISHNQAFILGEISDNGGGEVIEKGICWSVSENPTIEDSTKVLESNENKISYVLSGLKSNAVYHVRFYAINQSGVSYSNEIVFKTAFKLETFTDPRDRNEYQTVQIGEATWMAENLMYLPNVMQPIKGSFSDSYKYVYGQTSCGCLGKAKANENYGIYGALYNWVSANQLCPAGWHLPSDEEWENLANSISVNNGGYENTNGTYENVAIHLKSAERWESSEMGINDYGFSALPAGFRDSESISFLGLSNEAFYWTSSQMNDTLAWGRTLKVDDNTLYRQSFLMSDGFSVRCVKD